MPNVVCLYHFQRSWQDIRQDVFTACDISPVSIYFTIQHNAVLRCSFRILWVVCVCCGDSFICILQFPNEMNKKQFISLVYSPIHRCYYWWYVNKDSHNIEFWYVYFWSYSRTTLQWTNTSVTIIDYNYNGKAMIQNMSSQGNNHIMYEVEYTIIIIIDVENINSTLIMKDVYY